jgi:hypothetical protein
MTARQDYTLTITISNATEDEAEEVRSEITGSIEDARDSGIWSTPVDVDWGELEPLRTHR